MSESFAKHQLDKMSVQELQKHVANLLAQENRIEKKLTTVIGQNRVLSQKLVGGGKPVDEGKKQNKENNSRSVKEEKQGPKSSRQADSKNIDSENAPDSNAKGQGKKNQTKKVYVKKEPVNGIIHVQKQEDGAEEQKAKKQD